MITLNELLKKENLKNYLSEKDRETFEKQAKELREITKLNLNLRCSDTHMLQTYLLGTSDMKPDDVFHLMDKPDKIMEYWGKMYDDLKNRPFGADAARYIGQFEKKALTKLSEYKLPDIEIKTLADFEKVAESVYYLRGLSIDMSQDTESYTTSAQKSPEIYNAFMEGAGGSESFTMYQNKLAAIGQSFFGNMQTVMNPGVSNFRRAVAFNNIRNEWNADLHGKKLGDIPAVKSMYYEFIDTVKGMDQFDTDAAIEEMESKSDELMEFMVQGRPENELPYIDDIKKTIEQKKLETADTYESKGYINETQIIPVGQYADAFQKPFNSVTELTAEEQNKLASIYASTVGVYLESPFVSGVLSDKGIKAYDIVRYKGQSVTEYIGDKYDALSEEDKERAMKIETAKLIALHTDDVTIDTFRFDKELNMSAGMPFRMNQFGMTYSKKGKLAVNVQEDGFGNVSESCELIDEAFAPKKICLSENEKGRYYSDKKYSMKAALKEAFEETLKEASLCVAKAPDRTEEQKLAKAQLAEDYEVLKDALKISDEKLSEITKDLASVNRFQYAFSPSAFFGENKKYHKNSYPDMLDYLDIPAETKSLLAKSELFDKVALTLASEVMAVTTKQQRYREAGIPEGVSQSRHQEALGNIAALIGEPELVSETKRVPEKVDDKIVYGTFVVEPEGKKIYDEAKDNIFLDKNNNPLKQPEAMKQLAAMQVLDYISGSQLYGMEDLTFRTDKNDPQKITGIVRHAPGNCFGLYDPDDPNRRSTITHSTCPSLENMKVIPEKTAEFVKGITKEKIELALAGMGMKPAQVEACWTRTQNLQKMLNNPSAQIKDGQIKIVKDDEWKDIDFTRLYVNENAYQKGREHCENMDLQMDEGACPNIFGRAKEVRSQAKEIVHTMERHVKSPNVAKIRDFEDTVKRVPDKDLNIGVLMREFPKVDPKLLISSKEFKDMKTAVSQLGQQLTELSKKNGKVSDREREQVRQSVERAAKAADKYIVMKDREGVKGRYGQKRYDFATSIRNYTQMLGKEMEKRLENKKTADKAKTVDKKNILQPNDAKKGVINKGHQM